MMPYQDLWRHGDVIEAGDRSCTDRYATIHEFVSRRRPKVLIIIPYIDALDLTEQTLRDALAQTDVGTVRVLLIDQASSGEGRAWGDKMQSTHERQVLCWHYDPQLSLGAAWNAGMAFAEACGEEGALIINNDIRMRTFMAEQLQGIAEARGAYFVSGVGVDEAGWEAPVGKGVVPGAVGGPDFSCYYFTLAGWRAYPYDELFYPAYTEDVDMHRRMLLGGDGEKIFGVNLPFRHFASGTINQSAEVRQRLTAMFGESYAYFSRKWGGKPNKETYWFPFNKHPERPDPRPAAGTPPQPTTPFLFKYIQEGRAEILDELIPHHDPGADGMDMIGD